MRWLIVFIFGISLSHNSFASCPRGMYAPLLNGEACQNLPDIQCPENTTKTNITVYTEDCVSDAGFFLKATPFNGHYKLYENTWGDNILLRWVNESRPWPWISAELNASSCEEMCKEIARERMQMCYAYYMDRNNDDKKCYFTFLCHNTGRK